MNCGKEIHAKAPKSITYSQKELVFGEPQSDNWIDGSYPVDIVQSKIEPKTCWFDHGFPRNIVDLPFHWISEKDSWYLLFHKTKGQPLSQYLTILDRSSSSERFEIAAQIVQNLLKLSALIHKKDYVLGCVNFESLWTNRDDFKNIQIRQFFPILVFKDDNPLQEIDGFCSPEVINRKSAEIGPKSDVFAIGSAFVGIVANRFQFIDFTELSHYAHQFRFFVPDAPMEIHSWLSKSVSLDRKLRFENVSAQANALKKVLNRNKQRQAIRPSSDIVIGYGVYSDPGMGKLRPEDDYRLMDEVNEDRFFFSYHPDGKNMALAIVADGISNCNYGTGSEAAEIVISVGEKIWNANARSIKGLEDAEELVLDIIAQANAEVVKAAKEYVPSSGESKNIYIAPGDFMGSTCAISLLCGNQSVFASLGDSRIYIWSPDDGLMLVTPDHNQLNDFLFKGKDWKDARKIEGSSALTQYIGQIEGSKWPPKPKKPDPFIMNTNIRTDEIIMMCTDGFTDYIPKSHSRKGSWDTDRKLSQLIDTNLKETNLVKSLSQKLGNEANKNGGGDNITILTLKIKKQQKQ